MFNNLLKRKENLLMLLGISVIGVAFITYLFFSKKSVNVKSELCNKQKSFAKKDRTEDNVNKNIDDKKIDIAKNDNYTKDLKSKSEHNKEDLYDYNSRIKSDDNFDDYTYGGHSTDYPQDCSDDALDQLQDLNNVLSDLVDEPYDNDLNKLHSNPNKDNKIEKYNDKKRSKEDNKTYDNENYDFIKDKIQKTKAKAKRKKAKENLDQLDALVQLQARVIEQECMADINGKVRESISGAI